MTSYVCYIFLKCGFAEDGSKYIQILSVKYHIEIYIFQMGFVSYNMTNLQFYMKCFSSNKSL